MRFLTGSVAGALVVLLLAATASAATYYIDFAEGDNTADGLSPRTAWKHSPGDRNATDNPKDAKLEPDDTIIFKGGVHYYGSLELDVSGADGKPITLDGNTAGTFGEGKAILDGGKLITDWKRVESAEEVRGNPRWEEMFYADIDVDVSSHFTPDRFVNHRSPPRGGSAPWQRIPLIDSERGILPIAQNPKPSDPFYPDRPGDFFESPHPLTDNYPHKLYYEEGTIGNRTLPLLPITFGCPRGAPVIAPLNGGEVSLELDKKYTVAEIGIMLSSPQAPEHISFLVDAREVIKVEIDPAEKKMQHFKLPEPIQAGKITYKLLHSGEDIPGWTKLRQIAAFTPEGENIIERPIGHFFKDEERFTQKDPSYYEGMFIGVHGGNNHVYFAVTGKYEPDTRQLDVPYFNLNIYPQTRYALYNSPKFIELPGEWCVKPIDGGTTRFYLLPEHLENGLPVNIGYPERQTGVLLNKGAAHIDVRGLIIQRFGGGSGGVAVARTAGTADQGINNITVADCEVRFSSFGGGINLNYCNNIILENNYIHHNSGWTRGLMLNRVNNFRLSRNRLFKNAGSGIRLYESKNGAIQDNSVLEHFGMHASGVNFYFFSENIIFERNYVGSVLTMSQSKNIVLRNNVIDVQGRNSTCVSLYGVYSMENLYFLNNTFVGTNHDVVWSCAILGKAGPKGSSLQRVVIKNNILDRISEYLPGVIENNIFLRENTHLFGEEVRLTGPGANKVVTDLHTLFVDPDNGDWRLKEGSPAINAGADMRPPVREEEEDETGYFVADDINGTPRPQGGAFDIGAYEFKAE